MNNKRLEKIKERLSAATEGVWVSDGDSVLVSGKTVICDLRETSFMLNKNSSNDSNFIAYSKDDIQYLLDEVERLHNTSKHLNLEAQKYFDMLVEEQFKTLRYEEVLKFYADVRNYEPVTNKDDGTRMFPPNIIKDRGEKAEKALNINLNEVSLTLNSLDAKLQELGQSDSSVEYASHIKEPYVDVLKEVNELKQQLGLKEIVKTEKWYYGWED